MVKPKDRFLIDTAFMLERTHKTFFETPLLTIDGKDHTCTFGFVRDFLRMRRRLGIRHSVLVIGKDSHTLTSEQQLHDVMDFLQRFELPYVTDPLHSNLQIGFDHGAGHPLLFLDDAKAPNCQKNNGFSDLGNYAEWPKVAGAVIQAYSRGKNLHGRDSGQYTQKLCYWY